MSDMSYSEHMNRAAFVVIADGEIDQICGTLREARREAADLRAMGCVTRVKQFATWQEAHAFEDKRRGY